MEDKLKNLEHGVQILSTVALSKHTPSLDIDTVHEPMCCNSNEGRFLFIYKDCLILYISKFTSKSIIFFVPLTILFRVLQ